MAGATETVELPIVGMTCDHCAGTVRRALEGVPGVRSATVDLEANRAVVTLDEGTAVDRLQEAVQAVGYRVPDPEPSAPPTLVTIGPPPAPARDGAARELAIGGMHCGSCVARVEAALAGVPGVREARVDLAGGRASVVVEPGRVADDQLVEAVAQAGYAAQPLGAPAGAPPPAAPPPGLVPVGALAAPPPPPTAQAEEWDLAVGGMHCASCVGRVEEALAGVPGVAEARVNLATERARVRLDPARVDEARLAEAVARAGYSARRAEAEGGPAAEAEAMRRERAEHVAYWRRRLIVGAALTIPLVVLGYAPMIYAPLHHAAWVGWTMFALATVLQAYLGGPYVKGAWGRLMQGSSNMDTLIALGSSTAYGYSLFGLLSGGRAQGPLDGAPAALASLLITGLVSTCGALLDRGRA